MRLRLVVKRHGLPDTPVAWAIDVSDNPTISQLLEQVNEVIPLESGGDWGLEDYAVDIKGSGTNFECLHFQHVASILHEDDEVIIRPLLSLDLKLRKVSGRLQITNDGRHLFDGSAFGRPRPRGSVERPAIEIPPRKRRRITYSEEASDSLSDENIVAENQLRITNDEEGNQQLILSADFEDDDEEDDEDFSPGEDDEAVDMDDELEGNVEADDGDEASDEASNDESAVADIDDEESRTKLRKLQKAFPKAPVSVCKHVLFASEGDFSEAWEVLSRGFKAAKPRKAITAVPLNLDSLSLKKTRSKRASFVTKKPVSTHKDDGDNDLDEDEEESAVDGEDNDIVGHYDQHGLPPGSISAGGVNIGGSKATKKKFVDTDEAYSETGRSGSARKSDKNVRFHPSSIVKNVDEVTLDDDDESDVEDFDATSNSEQSDIEDSSEVSSSSEDSSEDSSDSSGDSDDDAQKKDSVTSTSESSSDDSSDTSSSSSSSDSEPEETSSKITTFHPSSLSKGAQINATAGGNLTDQTHKPKQYMTVAPGSGKKSTRSRNVRRRKANELQRLQSKGILPAGMTLSEFQQLDMQSIKGPDEALAALSTIRSNSKNISKGSEKAAAKAAEFEARREELLASLALGGIEVGAADPSLSKVLSADAGMTGIEADFEIIPPAASEQAEENKGPLGVPGPSISTTAQAEVEEATSADSTPRVRKRLNLGAAGRLVFGALGVKTPKTKADQEKVRNDLVKHVRPVKTAAPKVDIPPPQSEETEEPDTWREVITLRAVECCHEGIDLSPAPFPFVQRWDPQQQGSYSQNKRGSKRQKRNQAQYYDNAQHSSKKQKHNHYDSYDDSYNQHSGFGYDMDAETGNDSFQDAQNTLGDGVGCDADDQLMNDVQTAADTTGQDANEDDLPYLPEDMSTLSDLVAGGIKSGMVIAFKQLVMSEETNWQPQMSDYRTAQVAQVSTNGDIELILAKRDRQWQKYYDEETGERIYGKFEMPLDDDEDEADDGFLVVTFGELVEPKIVKLIAENTPTPPIEASQGKRNGSTDDSVTLDHECEIPQGDAFKHAEPSNGQHDSREIFEVPNNGNEDDSSPSLRGGYLSSNAATTIVDERVDKTVEVLSTVSSVQYPKISLQSSLTSEFADHGRQPDFPTPGDETLERFEEYDLLPEQADSILVEEPGLPTTIDEDFILPQSSVQQSEQNESLSSDGEFPSLDEVFSTARSQSLQLKPDGSRTDIRGESDISGQEPLESAAGTEIYKLRKRKGEGEDKDNEVRTESNNTIDSYTEAMAALDAALDAAEDPDQVTPHASQRDSQVVLKTEPELKSAIEGGFKPPLASQLQKGSQKSTSQFFITPGSQQVDLTISSDNEPEAEKMDKNKNSEGEESYDDLFGLPAKSGRVTKRGSQSHGQARRQSNVNTRASSSQAEAKAKSSRRKTTARF